MRTLILCWLALLSIGFAQDQGALRVKTVCHQDGTRTDTKTDPVARTTETTEIDAAGKIIQRVLYRLDAQDQPDAGIVYDSKGRILYKMKLKRDAQNRLAEQTDFTATDKFVRRIVYTYDSKNRVTKIDTFDEAGKLLGTSSATQKKKR